VSSTVTLSSGIVEKPTCNKQLKKINNVAPEENQQLN
jgi:hypothetical protein